MSNLLTQNPGLVPVDFDPDRQVLVWKDLGDWPFKQPFFSWSVYEWEQTHGPAKVVETDLTPLYEANLVPDPAPPAGFVFHCSRCGSTLLARILSNDPLGILLSEPDPLNSLLFPFCQRSAPGIPLPEKTKTFLRNLILSLGRKRGRNHLHSYIKFTSWNVLLLDVIREVFPEVPTVFLYRDPAAVLVSLDKSPAGFSEPGDDPFSRFVSGRPEPEPAIKDPLEHTTEVLRKMLLAASSDPTVLCIDHQDLIPDKLPSILARFHIDASEATKKAMVREFDVYAKHYGPDVPYQDDTEAKAREVTPPIRSAATSLLGSMPRRTL